MKLGLFRKRTIYWPTWKGWLLIVLLLVLPPAWWWFRCEGFLARTDRVDADVLVVEGWIGSEAVAAAAEEFKEGAYRYVVATGRMTDSTWTEERWSYAEIAAKALRRAGISAEQIVLAPAAPSAAGRTYQSAVAVHGVLDARQISPTGVNVFTRGVHARRSRLVFDRVFASEVEVGVVAWLPDGFAEENWRSSTERAEDFLQESFGYVYELLLKSGR